MNPGLLPGPPPDLRSRKITLIQFDDRIFRTHRIDRNPVFYGKLGSNRFDAPDASYGVLYAGRDPFCAFIETFTRAAGTRIITTTALQQQALSELKPSRALRLVDLTESGTLMRIGADARLFAGEHAIAQAWSKALHEHREADGLLYPSRLDPVRQAVALFKDRAPKLVELSRKSWYATGQTRRLLAEVLDHYSLELIENRFVLPRKPVSVVRRLPFE